MATIIVKVTEKCNSNCLYCDVIRKANTGKTMPLEIVALLFQKSNEYLLKNKRENVSYLWHGGEPLLAGKEYYNQVIELQEKYCRKTKDRILHAMQTNLTCLDEGFVDIFQQLGIKSVGTSYDPEPHMRGPGKNVDTLKYNTNFLNATRILDKYDIGWGMIYVVTKKSLKDPVGIFYFLTNLLLTGGINFNQVLIYDEERKDLSITPQEFVEFLGKIFPVWWENRNRYPDIEPFKSLVNNIIHQHRSLSCVDSGACTYHHINISPDGDASQCGRSSDWALLNYGNIADCSIEDILNHPERKKLESRYSKLIEKDCFGCRFWEICHGGCPLDAWSKHKDFGHKTEWCYVKKGFIENYFEPVTGVTFEPQNN